jgi:hypothetical protein
MTHSPCLAAGGADTKNRAKPIETRSTAERRLTAEMTPIGMPMQSQISAAPTASWMVMGSRSSSRSRTGVRVT